MYEDSFLDSYWEEQNEYNDWDSSRDDLEEWEKDRLCEDLALEQDRCEVDEDEEDDRWDFDDECECGGCE